MSLIIRYGEKMMNVVEEDKTQTSVIEFIQEDLKADEIQFHSPLHRRILKEALAHIHDEGFSCRRFFLSYPEAEISEWAAELCTDRYQLSKMFSRTQVVLTEEDRLDELVSHYLLDFKYAIIMEELAQTKLAIHTAQYVTKDVKECDRIMVHYKAISSIRSHIAKPLGNRPLDWNQK